MFSKESLYQISLYKDSAHLCAPYAAQRDETGQCVCIYIFQIPLFFFLRVVFTFILNRVNVAALQLPPFL